MKKRALIIVFLLVALIAFYFIWDGKGEKKPTTLYEHIPNTNSIIGTFDYEGLARIVQTEMFRNPMELLRMRNSSWGKSFLGNLTKTLLKGGVDKQQQFIFSINQDTTQVSFLMLPVQDDKEIIAALQEDLSNYLQVTVQDGVAKAYNDKDRIGLVLNSDLLIVAKGHQKQVDQLWEQITTQQGCYASDDEYMMSLINNTHHLSVWIPENTLTTPFNEGNNNTMVYVDFLDGQLNIASRVVVDATYFTNTSSSNTYACDTCALTFHLNMKNTSDLQQFFGDSLATKVDSICQLFHIDYTQITNSFNGKLDAFIVGKEIEQNTIVTYEFDGDFNKVKREEVITTPMISFLLSYGVKKEGLYADLKRQGVVKRVNGKELFTNPIGKCYVYNNDQQLVFTTKEELASKKREKEVVDYGLVLNADVAKLIPLFNVKEPAPFNFAKSVKCEGKQQDSLIHFNVEVITGNPKRNALFDQFDSYSPN